MSKFAGNTSVQLHRPQRSEFDMSHTKPLTTRAGRLTPCFISECIPSDTFYGSTEMLVRLAPLVAPIYGEFKVYVHFFFVPLRLLWADSEEFFTGGRLGASVDPDNAPIPPYEDIGAALGYSPSPFTVSSLADYLGVPIFEDLPGYTNPASYDGKRINVLPFLAYQKVWLDYYRDRNYVEDDVLGFEFPRPSGRIALVSIFQLHNRGWEADYFTTALPFTQRGDEVLMPLAGTGSVNYLAQSRFEWSAQPGTAPSAGPASFNGGGSFNMVDDEDHALRVENIDSVDIDASSVSINDFRTAYALQVWLERNAVGGSRYVDSTQAHFGVRPQDSRLQRAEYLGGGVVPVKISEIVSTAYSQNQDDNTVPLANLAGHGVSYGNTNSFKYFVPEHGFVMGIMSIMSPGSYHQGLPRMFTRWSFLDYPWPTFAKLGEQQVDRYELFASPANVTQNADGVYPLFGYQSRYSDWKQIRNSVHGDFHDTLKFWTLVREFSSSPTLGDTFVTYDPSVQDRIFAVNGSGDNFWCYVNNRVSVRRALPYFGAPNNLGFQ